jgi:hypothetical protein
MTANTVLLHCEADFFDLPNNGQLQWVDKQLAQLFGNGEVLCEPHDLQPFPILGMPGWDKDNTVESYYDNRDYFRPGRRKKQQPLKEAGGEV